jgi:oxygen-dependent protoporphyrinogen oxidase
MSDRVLIVGGGVAGLATAHRLLRADRSLELTVLEAGERPGGRVRSVAVGDLDLEAGPDSFVARKPWAADLCRELGLELEEPAVAGAELWTDRGLVALPPTALGVPAAVGEILRWRALSRSGRARVLADLVRKPRMAEEDESLGSLARRRLGDEATELLVAPLLGGLYAGDVDRLGARASFPELERWERTFGSLIRGARAALDAGRSAGPLFRRPVGGMRALPDALLAAVGGERVWTSAGATAVEPRAGGPVVHTAAGELEGGAVVLAVPAFEASRLLSEASPVVAASLASIRYVSTGVVGLVYPSGTADALPETSGFVVPRDQAPMTAATFLSRKWPDPAFDTRAVVRCFVGAAGSEDVLDAPDEDIVEAVCRHLAAVVPLPERPAASAVIRWPRAMPQYEVGHLERVAGIEAALPPGIFVTGNAYRGVGIADTVGRANDVAEAVLAHLGTRAPERTERVP